MTAATVSLPWTPSDAVRRVCKQFHVTMKELAGKSRDSWIGLARGTLAAELREHGMGLERIAKRYLGNRDHSSVLYLIAKAKNPEAS